MRDCPLYQTAASASNSRDSFESHILCGLLRASIKRYLHPVTPGNPWSAITLTPRQTGRSVFLSSAENPGHHELSPETPRAGSTVPRDPKTLRGNCTHPHFGALSNAALRPARVDLAVRRSLRAIFFPLTAILIVFAAIILITTIIGPSSTAIPGSARNPRPAAAKRRLARGGGAQIQSKKAGSGKGQGVYRGGFVRDEGLRRIRRRGGVEEGRAAHGAERRWGRKQRRVLARARAEDSGPNRCCRRSDCENEGRHQEIRERRICLSPRDVEKNRVN